MTGAWSQSPVGEVARLTDLGALGKKLGQMNGESRRVCQLQEYPDWIYKEYLAPVSADHVRRLARLIWLPKQMTVAHRALVDKHTSWPTTQVMNAQQQTIGVLMPLAPAIFSTHRQMPGGRTEHKVLEVDMLALTEARQIRLKLPPQSLADRISICASITAVGALFERHGLVYLDWSYANVFWSVLDHSAYVIDLDGCSFGPRPQIQTPNWPDPLVPRGRDAGNESDRYRMALLIARCLTGERTRLAETRTGLFGLRIRGGATGELAGLLLQVLNARSTAERPSIAELSAALETAKKTDLHRVVPTSSPDMGGIKQWKPLPTRGTSTPNKTAPPPSNGGSTAERPSIAELSAALETAKKTDLHRVVPTSSPDMGGIKQWKPLPTRGTSTPNRTAPPPSNGPKPRPGVTPSTEASPPLAPRWAGSSSNNQPVWPPKVSSPSRPLGGGALLFIAILVILLLIVL